MAQRFEITHRHRWCAMAADDNACAVAGRTAACASAASRGLYCTCSSCAGAALGVIAMLVRHEPLERRCNCVAILRRQP